MMACDVVLLIVSGIAGLAGGVCLAAAGLLILGLRR